MRWRKQEIRYLQEHYPHKLTADIAHHLRRSVVAVYGKAKVLGLKKSEAFYDSGLSSRLDGVTGSSTRFKQGHRPHNTGVKGWQAGGNSAKTRFKSGNRPHNWVPVGTERTTNDGYQQRKMTDTGYPPHDWVFLHILLWEQHYGSLPEGHVVVFRNGNKTDIRIENLEMISRQEMMRRNTIHRYPDELKSLMHLQGKLRRTINEKQN